MKPGYSILILGPSGAGKSTFIRQALEDEGSGVAFLAPGPDELTSYMAILDKPGYYVEGFDDPAFLPAIGMREVQGLARAIKLANTLRQRLEEDFKAGKPLTYKVIAVDKISGFAELAVNVMLKACNLAEAPTAMSPEGARYYTGITNLLDQFMRPLRACRGYGAHLLVTSHVAEKEISPTAVAEVSGQEAHVPLIPGKGFREKLPGIFDLVFYAVVNKAGKLISDPNDPSNVRNDPNNPRHCLLWMPDPKKPTKSRLGPLSDKRLLPNEWHVVKALLNQKAGWENATAQSAQ